MSLWTNITGAPRLSGYRHFWIKAVTGFDPSTHCAKCLKGRRLFSQHSGTLAMEEHLVLDLKGAPFGYVCGVSSKGYAQNLHVAFRPKTGGVIEEVMLYGQRITICGAERLPILPLPDGWNGLNRKFTSCRNFQFGVGYFGYGPGISVETA